MSDGYNYVEYSCWDCFMKPGARKRLIPFELYKADEKFYCVLCGKEMRINTGLDDESINQLLNNDKK